MAKGDMVNGVFEANGTFQPAAGVECLILDVTQTSVGDSWLTWDGAITGIILAVSSNSLHGIKVPINNTIYLRYGRTTWNGFYSGVQIK